MSTQQPPARPWFRLASMAPRTAPAPSPSQTPQPDPVPQPRPAFIRPTFRTTSLPAQLQEPASAPAPPAVAPAPIASTAPMPLAFVAPVSTTVASAPAPATPRSPPTTAGVSATPRSSPITDVAPALAPSRTPPPVAAPTLPSPAAPKLPATTTSSSVLTSPFIRTSSPSSLFPSSPAPKASPTPTVQQSPKPKVSSPSSPLQNSLLATKTVSPAPAPNQITTAGTISAPATNSAYSPKPVNPHRNTPSPSPKIRPIVYPPSPLTLPPPAQIKSDNEGEFKIPLEVEQKTVPVKGTKEKPKTSPKNSNNNHLPRFFSEPPNTNNPHNGEREASKNVHFKNNGNHKKSLDSVDFGMRVLTLAGENKGAIMELSPSMKKYEFGNNPRSLQKSGAYRTWGEGEKSASDSTSSNEEGNSKRKDKSLRAMAKPSPPMTAFLNSNVQGVNNSILYNVTCSHHDPGIHLSLSRKPNDGRGSGFQ